MENLELRYAQEIRANTETGIISGTPIVFDSESVDLGGFNEIITREAATQEFLEQQDIVMLYNHNQDKGVLARYSPNRQRNSLHFTVDERGVHFEFKAKKNDAWLLESIENGDLNACSFAFRVADGGEKWEKRADGTYLRTVNKFDIVQDFSIVVFPAYKATSCNTRGLDELKQQEELQKQKDKEEAEKREQETAKKQKELEDYYKQFNDVIKTFSK
jgi:HK97 family phage prohead protease